MLCWPKCNYITLNESWSVDFVLQTLFKDQESNQLLTCLNSEPKFQSSAVLDFKNFLSLSFAVSKFNVWANI
jgi:hypothetical protein